MITKRCKTTSFEAALSVSMKTLRVTDRTVEADKLEEIQLLKCEKWKTELLINKKVIKVPVQVFWGGSENKDLKTP